MGMIVRRKVVNLEQKQARLDELFDLIQQGGDTAAYEKEAVSLYEAITGNRATSRCGLCIASRNRFIKGIQDLKTGEIKAGSAKIYQSMKGVSMKFSRLMQNAFG
jgi:hypothetical protein